MHAVNFVYARRNLLFKTCVARRESKMHVVNDVFARRDITIHDLHCTPEMSYEI